MATGCFPARPVVKADPNKIIVEGLANFYRQKSFAYNYQMKNPQTSVEFNGQCLVNRAELVKALWKFEKDTIQTEIIGLYSSQYEKKDGRWETHSRGEESNILVQIERTLKRNKFEFLGKEGKNYLYVFQPNLPFLDPTLKKKIAGKISLNRKTHLPQMISAVSEDSLIFWQVKLSNFNKPFTITAPNTDKKMFLLIIEPGEEEIVRKRLTLFGFDYTLTQGTNGFNLEIPEAVDKPLLIDLLAFGEFGIYDGAGLAKGALVSPTLDKKLINYDDIKKVAIDYDRYSRLHMTIHLKKASNFHGPFVLGMDRKIFATQKDIDKPVKLNKMVIPMEMDYISASIIAIKISSGPLKPLTISEVK